MEKIMHILYIGKPVAKVKALSRKPDLQTLKRCLKGFKKRSETGS
jgi:hypothetical protein